MHKWMQQLNIIVILLSQGYPIFKKMMIFLTWLLVLTQSSGKLFLVTNSCNAGATNCTTKTLLVQLSLALS